MLPSPNLRWPAAMDSSFYILLSFEATFMAHGGLLTSFRRKVQPNETRS
jgi:hypothetical protein